MSSYLPYHRCQIRQGITEVTGEGCGNMMPLPHTVHAVNYVTHAPPAKDFMSMPRQVFVA